MINHIGLKSITNNIDRKKDLPDDENNEVKDIEEEKIEAKNLKLIEYYKCKKEITIENDLDDLLMHYLDDDLKIRIQEDLKNKLTN